MLNRPASVCHRDEIPPLHPGRPQDQRAGHNGVTSDTCKQAQQTANVNRFAQSGKTNTRGAEPQHMASGMMFDQRNYMPTAADKERESLRVDY